MNDQVNSLDDTTHELIIPEWMWGIKFPQPWDNQILCSEDGLPFTPNCELEDLSEIIPEDTDGEA